ncbi:testin [Hypomesus transpacificus]|uniref:testin n=1 Tax=Hypomesus transpacificus TaxID=137520 RepID=UPI001F083DAE|nr:testin [Hypomesus transpacificus]
MEVEKEVKKMTLGHDFGAGAACLKCKDKCEGFELHFWRKICRNCKCGLTEHDVQMNSEENKKVGKLFEDTKYTGLIAKLKTDGVPTYKGNMVTITLARPSTGAVVPPQVTALAVPGAGSRTVPVSANTMPAKITPVKANSVPVKANSVPVKPNAVSANVVPVKRDAAQSVTYEWVPPGANQYLAVRYIELLPPERRPVAGTVGAAYRRQQMAHQLPEHDQDPSMCHELSPGEVKQMQQFVRKYKDEALGVGDICLPETMVPGGPGAAGGRPGPENRPGGLGEGGVGAGVGPGAGVGGVNAGAGYGPGAGGVGAGNRDGTVGSGAILTGHPCQGVRPGGGPVTRFPESVGSGGPGSLRTAQTVSPGVWAPGVGGPGVGGPGAPGVGGLGAPGVGGLGAPGVGGLGVGGPEAPGVGGPGVWGPGAPGIGGVGGPGAPGGYGETGDMGTATRAGAIGTPGALSGHTTEFPGQTFSCHQCQQPMRQGEPAVYAERAGYDQLWHPGCFVCCTCSELLVDMIYFWKKGKLYCGRHYGDSEKPRCGGCDELIFSNEYTQAEGQNWHLKHFCCFDCDCVLAGETYVMENDKPVCKPCYMKSHAVKCVACQKPVEPEAQRVSYGEHHWHAEPDCFQCSCCSKCLVGQRFMAMQGMLFCSVECKKKTLA